MFDAFLVSADPKGPRVDGIAAFGIFIVDNQKVIVPAGIEQLQVGIIRGLFQRVELFGVPPQRVCRAPAGRDWQKQH